MQKKFTFELAGRTITVETGKYAEQAGGAILISCGYTALLVCATVAKQAREGADFLPLSCDYEEKMYAAGKIPGGFIKREGRPSEKAILTSRLIDRPIRPLFPKGFYNDVQVVATAMSVERDVTPDVLAMNGASIALSISEAPFAGPIGAVSVGYVDGQYVINPDFEQRSRSRLHLTVAGTADAVMMVEAGANEISEQEMLDAILFGHEYIKQIVEWIKTIQAEVGKEKIVPVIHTPDEELKAKVVEFARAKVEWQLDTFDRKEREVRTEQVKAETIAHFAEEYPDSAKEIDGKVYGRGAMDMKGGLAAILETLTYYAAHLDEINGKILACFVADEEGLSKGTYQLVAEDVIHAGYAIMGECRYDNVAVGFRGRYSFEVTVHGQTAHASHYPEVGENALISGGRLAAAIEALPTLQHPHLKHGTWCVRYMEGGNPGTLVVPEKCYLFVDRCVVPGETDEICIAQIMEAAEQLGLSGKVDVRLKPRKSPYMQSFAVEEDHPLVKILQEEFHSVTGKDLPCAYDASVCDSNILAVSLGIPVVTFGPSGATCTVTTSTAMHGR